VLLGAGPAGFAAAYGRIEAGSALSLQTFDLTMNTLRRTSLSAGGTALAVVRGDARWWAAHQAQVERSAITLDRVADDGSLAAPIAVPAMGAAAATVRPGLSAAPSPGGLTFILSVRNELYLATARDDGRVGARRFLADASPVLGTLVPYGTGWAVVLYRSEGTGAGVWVMRLDCRGAVTEAPVLVAPGAASYPYGAALDATGRGLWIVVRRDLGGENYAFSMRRMLLP